MKRPMCVIGAALAGTTWAAYFFDVGLAMLLSGAALCTGALLLALLLRNPDRRRLRPVCAACFAVAVALALHARQEARIIEPFQRAEGQTVRLEGLVEEARRGRKIHYYEMAATFPDRPDLPDARITLRSYGEMEYLPGDILRCEAVLAPREQPERGLRYAADSFLEGDLLSARRLEDGFPFRRWLLRLRERLSATVYSALHPASADIVTAMVLGGKDNVSPETYAVVNRAGTVHLLSVSGLHLSILSAVVLGLLERLGLPRPLRSLATILAGLAFVCLVGFSASLTRAFAMTAIGLLAGVAGRRSDSLSALGFAVSAICLVCPGWVLGKGFWLSAGSTLGILLFAGKLTARLDSWLGRLGRLYCRPVRAAVRAGAVSVSAYAATLPLLVVFNGWVSLISPLANILITPFVPGVILGGGVCAAFGAGALPLRAAARITDLCAAAVLRVSEVMAGIPLATAPVDQVWMLLWGALAVFSLLVLVRFRAGKELRRFGALLLALAFSIGSLSHGMTGRERVELATIADCDAAVLFRDGEAVILGTPAYYEVNRLMRYLDYRGVSRIRAVVAADCGEQVGSGLPRLAERFPVDCILGPNDAYILEQLAAALPDTPVYSGGYATLEALDVAVRVTVPEGSIRVAASKNTVLKSAEKYAIMNVDGSYTIGLYPGGNTVLLGARGREPAPLGRMLFGESRFRLN